MRKVHILAIASSVVLLLILSLGLGLAQGQAPQAGSPQANSGTVPSASLGTSFTYQGQLLKDGSPVDDTCQVAFRLYDAVTGGTLVGSPLTATITIANGLFTVELDFGGTAFAGQARWLDLAAKCTGDTGFIALTPRQPLTAAPYAFYSLSTGALQGRAVDSTAPTTNQVLKWNGSAWAPGTDESGGTNFWSLTGNAGTVPGTNFLGTTDGVMLSLFSAL